MTDFYSFSSRIKFIKDDIKKSLTKIFSLKNAMPKNFFGGHFSPIATEEDIFYCFRLILERNPNPKEWSAHRKQAGKTISEVVSKFLSSTEFKTYKKSYLALKPELSDTDHEIVELQNFKFCASKTDSVCGSTLKTKEYEPAVTSLVEKILKPGMVFLDIGANIGFFSLLASSKVMETGKVFAFEPNEYNIKMLYINRLINNFGNIEIFPFAASDQRTFYTYDNSAGNSGSIFPNTSSISQLLSEKLVYAIVLDDVLDLYPDKIDLIKIDIEGAEYLAFKGMTRRLKRDRPIIISEFAPSFLESVSRISGEDYLKMFILNYDYELAVIIGKDQIKNCYQNIDQVVDAYSQFAADHIDILAYPRDALKISNNQVSILQHGLSVSG